VQHPTLRFQPIALVYSLPQAFVIWSIVLLATEIMSMIVESAHLSVLISLAVILGSITAILLIRLIAYAYWSLHMRLRQTISQCNDSPV
jgi:sensor c-di-GMP phosphodiesterase-like protein